MEPRLGWVWLSQTERRAAETALSEALVDGSRDELGFGVIHFAYADRFFPGTSVLHTGVRYVLFVCWAYQELLRNHKQAIFPTKALAQIEERTGRKLMEQYGNGDGKGIIGARVLRANRAPVTKPSRIYWNALKTWGLLANDPRTDLPYNQSDVHRRWSDFTHTEKRPEVDAAEIVQNLLTDLPGPPVDWQKNKAPLGFELSEKEKVRVVDSWRHVRRTDAPSLMSRLADLRKKSPPCMYAGIVGNMCNEAEKTSLKTAEQAASLVCLGRALYNAMVDDMKHGKPSAAGKTALDEALSSHQRQALDLDLSKLNNDVPKLGSLRPLLASIQEWAVKGNDYSHLVGTFRCREHSLKQDRALLLEKSSARREAWSFSNPRPLTYRWDNVSRFLNELAA